MEKQYWLDRWDNNDIGWNQENINVYLIKHYQQLNLKNYNHVFVPLCGKSIDMKFFLENGHFITGCELSIEASKDFFYDNNLYFDANQYYHFEILRGDNIDLFCGDLFKIEERALSLPIDLVYDRGAIVALPKEMRVKYFEHINSLIKSGTRWIIMSLEHESVKHQGPPFSVTLNEIEELAKNDFNVELIEEEKVINQGQRLELLGKGQINRVILLEKK